MTARIWASALCQPDSLFIGGSFARRSNHRSLRHESRWCGLLRCSTRGSRRSTAGWPTMRERRRSNATRPGGSISAWLKSTVPRSANQLSAATWPRPRPAVPWPRPGSTCPSPIRPAKNPKSTSARSASGSQVNKSSDACSSCVFCFREGLPPHLCQRGSRGLH